MFGADMTEKRDRRRRRVTIEGLSAEAVGDPLTFVYTDSAPNIAGFALELLGAAEKYNVPRLKMACELELGGRLSVDTVLDVLCCGGLEQAPTR